MEKLSLGIRVLKHFPDQETSQLSLNYPTIQCDVNLHIPTLKYCLESIWSSYEELQAERRSPQNLATMAKVLFRNGQEAAPSCRTTAEWPESFTGRQLRWEIAGTLFAIFGLQATSARDWRAEEPHDGTVKDKRRYVRKMSECAEACLVLCDDGRSINEFSIWLMHHVHTLDTFYSGIASESSQLGSTTARDIATWRTPPAKLEQVVNYGEGMVLFLAPLLH